MAFLGALALANGAQRGRGVDVRDVREGEDVGRARNYHACTDVEHEMKKYPAESPAQDPKS